MNTPCPVCGAGTRDGHICHTCTRDTRHALRDLPWLYARLDETIGRRDHLRTSGGGKAHADPDRLAAILATRHREKAEADAAQLDPDQTGA